MKAIIDTARSVGRHLTGSEQPFYWALVIGVLITQGRSPTRGSYWEIGVWVGQLLALRVLGTRPAAAYAVSTAIELAASAYGVAPTSSIGAFIVCAAVFQKVEFTRGRGMSIEGSLVALTPLAALAFVPWALHLRAGAVYVGPAHAHSPWDTLIVLLFATLLRSNWNVVDSLLLGARRRADDAEAARDAAVAEERTRIARELHDVVAHQMSVVVTQAQGAEAVLATNPQMARRALDTISATTRDALVELRRLVDVTRREPASKYEPEGPQPGLTLTDLARLATTAEAAGLEVEMHIALGEDRPVPAGVGLSAYRTIQESLTNAAKHAPRSAARVDVRWEGSTLVVEVRNGPARDGAADLPGSGVGLIGMRERVSVFGGTLATGPTADGGWSVVARFPTLEPPTTSE